MGRDLPTGFSAKTEAAVFNPALLVELDWPGGMVRAWSGYGSLVWDGKTFLGVADHGGVSQIREATDGRANGMMLTLSGIPSSLVPEILSNDAQGRSGRVYVAALDDDGALSVDPYLIFDGFIDVTPFEDSGNTASISVALEKERINRRTQSRRRTHEDQQIDSPGDGYFRYVAGLATKSANWGGKTSAGSSATPAGVGRIGDVVNALD